MATTSNNAFPSDLFQKKKAKESNLKEAAARKMKGKKPEPKKKASGNIPPQFLANIQKKQAAAKGQTY